MTPKAQNIYLTWRRGRGERRVAVGVVETSPSLTFRYLPLGVSEAEAEGFSHHPCFPDTGRVYTENIATVLAQRIISPSRPDAGEYYDFWEISREERGDVVSVLAHSSGTLPTDTFEWLAEFDTAVGLRLVTDLAGLTGHPLDTGSLRAGDTLTWEREPCNPYDPCAVRVMKDGTPVGYVKRVHNRVFSLPGSERLTVTVKRIEHNGHINRAFLLIRCE